MPLTNSLLGSNMLPLSAQAIVGTVTTQLTALGNNQATALQITDAINVFTTVTASTGAMVFPVPAAFSAGDTMTVVNLGANTLTAYPPVGSRFGLSGVNAGRTIATGSTVVFTYLTPTQIAVVASA